MIKDVAIYGERCPEGLLRYIGKSSNPRRRRADHLFNAKTGIKSHHYNWLRSLSKPPDLELLARAPANAWEDVERYWIALAKDYGCKLTNQTEGGEAPPNPLGRKQSEETRRKKSVVMTGKPRSLAHSAKLSASLAGRKLTSEQVEKIRISSILRVQTPAQVAGLIKAAATQRQRRRSTNTTGYNGVGIEHLPGGIKFKAQCSRPEGTRYLGLFATAEEAAREVDKVVHRWHPIGSFLNFPFLP